MMKTREEILAYALSFAEVYTECPFRDQNWQLVRLKENKKAFLWIYDRGGYLNLNVKVAPEWRDFWRNTYPWLTKIWQNELRLFCKKAKQSEHFSGELVSLCPILCGKQERPFSVGAHCSYPRTADEAGKTLLNKLSEVQ